VQKAIETLSSRREGRIDREKVVAYSTLAILSHHYPSLVTDGIRALLSQHEDIKHRERSRFVKQRRIALSKIVSELTQDKTDT
jgi:hypothetical protein